MLNASKAASATVEAPYSRTLAFISQFSLTLFRAAERSSIRVRDHITWFPIVKQSGIYPMRARVKP
jgi:hypothetical protein